MDKDYDRLPIPPKSERLTHSMTQIQMENPQGIHFGGRHCAENNSFYPRYYMTLHGVAQNLSLTRGASVVNSLIQYSTCALSKTLQIERKVLAVRAVHICQY
jgi:hypothetical protein